MIREFTVLRGLVYLRRIAVSLERLVALQDHQLELDARRNPPPTSRSPRPVELGVATVAGWNKRYSAEHPDYTMPEEES